MTPGHHAQSPYAHGHGQHADHMSDGMNELSLGDDSGGSSMVTRNQSRQREKELEVSALVNASVHHLGNIRPHMFPFHAEKRPQAFDYLRFDERTDKVVTVMYDNLKGQADNGRGAKDTLNRIRDPKRYTEGSASNQLIIRMTTSSLLDEEDYRMFQFRPNNDFEAIIPLVKIVIFLCKRYNSVEAQERLEKSIGETPFLFHEGADAHAVVNKVENLVVLLGLTRAETEKMIVKKYKDSLKFMISKHAGNTPVQNGFLKLLDQVNQEQKLALASCDNNAYKALLFACEKIQDLDSNVLIREQHSQRQLTNLPITGSASKSPSSHRSHSFYPPRTKPHLQTYLDSKVFEAKTSARTLPTPFSELDLTRLPSIRPNTTADPALANSAYQLICHNCISEQHPESMCRDPQINAPYPEDENDHDACWYFAVNSDLDPHHAEVSEVEHQYFVHNAVAYLQELAMHPVTGACPVCGFENVHDGVGCPYLDRMLLTRERVIMMSVFRLSFQDPDTQKIWINQSVKQGCLKSLGPNELHEFKDAVNKQTALNDQRKRDARAAQASGHRIPPYRTPFPPPNSFNSGSHNTPPRGNFGSSYSSPNHYGQGHSSSPFGSNDYRQHASSSTPSNTLLNPTDTSTH